MDCLHSYFDIDRKIIKTKIYWMYNETKTNMLLLHLLFLHLSSACGSTDCHSWEAGSQSSQCICNMGKIFPTRPILGKVMKLITYSTKGGKNYNEIDHISNSSSSPLPTQGTFQDPPCPKLWITDNLIYTMFFPIRTHLR